jgi:tRNA(His) guanylyltransferase
MSLPKTKERLLSYQETTDFKLLSRLPIIFTISGRNFSKASSLCEKPFDEAIDKALNQTMMRIVSEIDGAFFAYHCCDEIMVIARNDQSAASVPWLANKLQKLISTVAAVSSVVASQEMIKADCGFLGDAIMLTNVFTVPSLPEAMNAVIYKQQNHFYHSVHFACYYELLKKFDRHKIKDLLDGLSLDDKVALLKDECGKEFSDYPIAFRRGTGAWREQRVVDDSLRNIWELQEELPILSGNGDVMDNIFKLGHNVSKK